MYHDGYTKRGVTIQHDYAQDFEYDCAIDVLKINPHTMVGTIETHFAGYIAKLQPDTPELDNFLKFFNQPTPPPANPPVAAPVQTPTGRPPQPVTPQNPMASRNPQGGQGGATFGGMGGLGPSGVV